jgi:hypothetical protein
MIGDYALQIDGRVYTVSPVTREKYTLVSAMQEARGCGNCRVVRGDKGGKWETVVLHAGSDSQVRHEPTGRTIYRRPVRRAGVAATWAAFLYGSERRKAQLLAQLADDVEDAGVMSYADIKAAAADPGLLDRVEAGDAARCDEWVYRAERRGLERALDRIDAGLIDAAARAQQLADRALRPTY